MSIDVTTPVGPSTPAALPPEVLPKVDQLVTEDDTPVDNLFSEKQQRLLTEPLYCSWSGEGRPFLVAANVGIFFSVRQPPIVPDVFLSRDVEAPTDWWAKHRSYFLWEFGKPPEVTIEIVSNRAGEELEKKFNIYASIGIPYYVVWDPQKLLGPNSLQLFSLHEKSYIPMKEMWFPAVGLGLTLWHGTYEAVEADWLRWCDQKEKLIPTGAEQCQRADKEAKRAEQEAKRAEQEAKRVEQLAAQLRALGIEPKEE